jgi:hypothetical protein
MSSSSSVAQGKSHTGYSIMHSAGTHLAGVSSDGPGASSSASSVLPLIHPTAVSHNLLPFLNQITYLRFAIEGVDNTLKDIRQDMVEYFSRDKNKTAMTAPPSSSNKEVVEPIQVDQQPHQNDNPHQSNKPITKEVTNGRKRKRRETKKKTVEQESKEVEEQIQSDKKNSKPTHQIKEKSSDKATKKKEKPKEKGGKIKPKPKKCGHLGSGTSEECAEEDLLEEYIKNSLIKTTNPSPSSSSSSSAKSDKSNCPNRDGSESESDSSDESDTSSDMD